MNLSTPANYFHALRRQQHRDFRQVRSTQTQWCLVWNQIYSIYIYLHFLSGVFLLAGRVMDLFSGVWHPENF